MFFRGKTLPQKFDPINFSEKISADPKCHATLSSDRYTSPDFMRLEWEKIWTQCWLFAGLESDVKDVGEFFVYDIGRESIIVHGMRIIKFLHFIILVNIEVTRF